jgi:3-deoxy-D-manno-octulosonic acid kinase
MAGPTVIQHSGQVIWHDARILPVVTPDFFDAGWHAARGSLRGAARGRGQSHFLHWGATDLVLRRFRRGGLIGKVNADCYLRLGAMRSRACREYHLLDWMRRAGLPVPRPVAARYAPFGLCYRADLVTERIPDARPLAEILQERALPPAVWSDIGAVIRRMHDAGVDHVDLNCRNILLDGGDAPWLIDFDRCRRRATGSWTGGNLSRLRRSLEKEARMQPGLRWSDADWTALLQGYGASGGLQSAAAMGTRADGIGHD